VGKLPNMADTPTRRDSFVTKVPEGDNRPRQVCTDCGYVQYENPKVVVGSVCTWEDKILLCRRDIEPRRGFWTLPAGYLEVNETSSDGAMREAWEEAYARIAI
jgi:8-oxo-dGTP pyrophosphatase MutT (NUDIX family)